jgi:hypothetical protein
MGARMPDEARETTTSTAWEPPAFEVISLACEISAYAPDDRPLF